MSLLMDALKKAELAKQQGQGTPAAEAAPSEKPAAPRAEDMELQPMHAPADRPAPGALPELPSQLEALDEEFLAQAAADKAKAEAAKKAAGAKPTAPKPPPVIRAEPLTGVHQAQAQNLFAAKQPPAGNKPFAIVVGTATLLAVAGIGIYFWLQLQPAGGLNAIAPITAPARSVATVPLVAVAPPQAAPAPVPLAALPPVAQPAADAKELPPAAREEAKASPAPRRAAEPEGPVRLTRSTLKVNPALTRGFDAFNSGDLAVARSSYEQALKADGKNVDALHGLAAIALREGRPADAEALYLQAIEADPKDAVAQAAVSSLHASGDPVATESRLQSMVAAQPDQPFLQFALGNVYAAQGRWPEAQAAYFKAFTADPGNPDYLFNLAVSLDQLHQGKLAVQYYNQALAAASQRPAGFDKAQAANRLRELQP